jgi:hypothetical protein
MNGRVERSGTGRDGLGMTNFFTVTNTAHTVIVVAPVRHHISLIRFFLKSVLVRFRSQFSKYLRGER